MSDIKTSKIVKLIEIFDQMSKDLSIGRLSKKGLMSKNKADKETNNKTDLSIIKNINFLDYNGYTISKSTLYKALKSLCDKNLITHLGTKRSSIYKLN